MSDLMRFLQARLDEDERELRKDPPTGLGYANLSARIWREVEAKRAILKLHEVYSEPERWGVSHSDWNMRGKPTGRTTYWCETCDHDRDYGHIGGPQEGCETLLLLAAAYSDHPVYDEAWKPQAVTGRPSA